MSEPLCRICHSETVVNEAKTCGSDQCDDFARDEDGPGFGHALGCSCSACYFAARGGVA